MVRENCKIVITANRTVRVRCKVAITSNQIVLTRCKLANQYIMYHPKVWCVFVYGRKSFTDNDVWSVI